MRNQDEGPNDNTYESESKRSGSKLRPPTPIRKSEALEATLKRLENDSAMY